MKITTISEKKDVDIYAAWHIIGQILIKPQSVIGLSTGQTTIGIHSTVAEIYQSYHFFTSEVKVFGVDEIVMLPSSSTITCGSRLLEQFVKPLNIPESNFIMPATISDDYEEESLKFESKILQSGGIDLQILGLGPDGHIAMNLPGSSFESKTRSVYLSGELEARLKKQATFPPDQRLKGITLGIRTIMNAKKIVLVAKGEKKSNIVKQALFGPVSPNVPASILQLHPDCEFVLDAEAASELSE